MRFKVEQDFQHDGINYEPGNVHTKHGLSDEVVQSFADVGWVNVGVAVAGVESALVVQPHDMTIVLKSESKNG